MTEIELRAVKQVEVASFPQRLIELVVMPYEEATTVPYRGRTIEEIVSRGAFEGIQRRNRKIVANRDHDLTRIAGKVIALHPSRQEGLVAEIRISATELGDETLQLADDGILDGSAGFSLALRDGKVRPDAEVWESRSRRRLNHLWLHHIAFTPEAAYESAQVLAVRGREDAAGTTPAATPNLDVVRGWRLADRYATIR